MAEQTISTELRLNAQQFIAEAEKAAAAARKIISESEKGAPAATSGWEKFNKKVSENRQAMTAVGAGMAAVGAVMLGVTGKVASTGIAFNSLEQTSRAALTTVLGSAKAANEQMDALGDFVKKSPFAKDTFIEAQKQLLGFGIAAQKVIPYLDAIQNAVAAVGGSNQQILELSYIFGKISSTSKVTAVDLMQFGKRGVDAAELIGLAMGKTAGQIRSEITAGTLNADAALDALAQGMMQKFDGAAAGIKNTFSGALQRVGAAFRDFASNAMDPFVSKEGGGLFVGWLNNAADMIRMLDKLPGPAKTATVSLGAISGAALTASGGFLVLAPRILDTLNKSRELAAMMPRLSSAMKITGIAGGILTGVLTAASIGFAIAGDKAAKSAAQTEQYASIMRDTTLSAKDSEQALRNTTREALAMSKVDWGGWQKFVTGTKNVPELFEKVGSSIGEVTNAVHGSQADFDALDQKFKALAASTTDFKMMGAAQEASTQLHKMRNAYMEATEATDAYAEAADAAGDASGNATAGIEAEAEAAAQAQEAVDGYRAALAALVEYQNAQANAANAAINAEREWINARNALTESIQENGATLDQNTEAGQKNMQAWQDLIAKSSEYVQTAIENGDSADVVAAKWDEAKGVLAELGAQLNTGGEEALEMAHRLGFLTDADYEFFLKMHAEEAEAELAAVEEQLHGLPRETIVDILARDNASDVIAVVEAALEAGVPPETIAEIIANDQVTDKVPAIQAAIEAIPSEWETWIEAHDNASAPAGAAKSMIEIIPNTWLTVLRAKDDSSAKSKNVKSAAESIPTSRRTTLSAQDSASSVVRSAQAAINSLTDKTVTITANYVTTGAIGKGGMIGLHKATGGRVTGPGSWTSDSVPAMLSNYEHVMTAREVWNLGGHGNVYALRRMIRENPRDVRAVLGFADGGTPAGQGFKPTLQVAAPGPAAVVVPAAVVKPDIHVTAFLENPFTGEQVRAEMARTVVEFGGGR